MARMLNCDFAHERTIPAVVRLGVNGFHSAVALSRDRCRTSTEVCDVRDGRSTYPHGIGGLLDLGGGILVATMSCPG